MLPHFSYPLVALLTLKPLKVHESFLIAQLAQSRLTGVYLACEVPGARVRSLTANFGYFNYGQYLVFLR